MEKVVRQTTRWSLRILLGGSLALGWAGPAPAQGYEVVDLGTLGGAESRAWGISENGAVSGWSTDTNGRVRAFIWHNGKMEDLGTLPGATNSEGRRISGDRVIGHAQDTNGAWRAVVWTDGTMSNLTAGGLPQSWGYDINETGEGIGRVQLPPDCLYEHACLFKTGTVIDLGTFNAGGYSSWPMGINDRTQVVGHTFAFVPEGRFMPFVWEDKNGNDVSDPGEMELLGTFGGDYGMAYDINNSSQVVGLAQTTNVEFHAFLVNPRDGVWKMPPGELIWTNAYMTDLGTLGGTTSRAYAINGSGVIVGEAATSGQVMNAFIWRDGVMTDLHDSIPTNSGWHLLAATDINEIGEIVGYGTIGGETHGFLLTALAEILQVAPMGTFLPGGTYTNGGGQTYTQYVFNIEGVVLRWSSVWDLAKSNFVFTVEGCDLSDPADWFVYPPTDQWPIAGSMWTSPVDPGIGDMLFRVRGENVEP